MSVLISIDDRRSFTSCDDVLLKSNIFRSKSFIKARLESTIPKSSNTAAFRLPVSGSASPAISEVAKLHADRAAARGFRTS